MAERFELKEGVNRVETNVPGHDKPIVIAEAGLETADPMIIAALHETDGVKHVPKKSRSESSSKKEA